MAIAVLGMAFAGQVTAQNDSKVSGGGSSNLIAAGGWTTWYDYTDENGKNQFGCCGAPVNCAGGN